MAPGEDDLVVDHGQSAKNVFTQASRADGSGDGCQADRNYGGDANSGDDDSEREWEFDLKK